MRALFILFSLTLSLPAQAGIFTSALEDDEERAQQRTALMLEIAGMERINQVIYRLETAAVPLCEGETAPNPGFAVASRDRFPSAFRAAAASLGYDRKARVMYVASDSPAARAGLSKGDLIVAVNGREIEEDAAAHEAVARLLRKAEAERPVTLTVVHDDGVARELSFTVAHACNYTPQLTRSHVVNAATTGWDIHATTALLDFLDDDHDLAAVLAHEIAHSMMSHVARKVGNQILGKVLDTVLGSVAGPYGGLLVRIASPGQRLGLLAYSQAFEREADYVSMYVLALAGYPMQDSPTLWRKLSVEFPGMEERSYFATHPANPERILLQQLTMEEIKAKIASGAPLLPEIERRVADIRKGAE